MNTQPITDAQMRLSPDWQEEFLTHLLPRVKSLARFRFRDLSAIEREEAEADSVAVAVVVFVRLAERGRNPSAFAARIARHAVQRVKAGRLVGSRDRSRDVLARLARQRHGFTVMSLASGKTQTRCGWQEIIVEDRRSTPAETAASRIDVGEWLNGMSSRRRQIAEMLAAGHSTSETAERFQITRGRVSQLRRAFEASWRAFQHEIPQRQPTAA